ncbi:helix-turn-helix transcriptional regulator [Bacillus glycinifermentans]|nr:helix-turn-helix transcriptional regulator [Bacillus glycinifermentans]
MHFKDLMTVGQISEKLNIPDWIILDLFKAKKVDKLNYPELCRRRRACDFDKLYDLHFNQRLSLNEIHRQFGYSPLYTKRVFKEKGLSHLGFINQLDK